MTKRLSSGREFGGSISMKPMTKYRFLRAIFTQLFVCFSSRKLSAVDIWARRRRVRSAGGSGTVGKRSSSLAVSIYLLPLNLYPSTRRFSKCSYHLRTRDNVSIYNMSPFQNPVITTSILKLNSKADICELEILENEKAVLPRDCSKLSTGARYWV